MTANAAIVSFSLERHAGEFVQKVESARGRWARREGLVLRLRDRDGLLGQGEAAPLPGYSRESLAECEAALRSVVSTFAERCMPAEEALGELALSAHWVKLASLPAARFALEAALLELLARRRDVSISSLLAGEAVRASVPRSGLLAGAGALDDARTLVAGGLRTLKVKVGVLPFDEELALLVELRRELGPGLALRLDAGGAWEVEAARQRLALLADEVRPELCEEPVAGEGMLRLGRTAIPWAADESLAIPGLAGRLVASPGCGALILKPALLGGLLPALDLARRAAARDVAVVVTHLFDGPLGLAAACELALAVPGTLLASGLEPHPGLTAWPSLPLPQLRVPGLVVPSGRPGLGIELTERATC